MQIPNFLTRIDKSLTTKYNTPIYDVQIAEEKNDYNACTFCINNQKIVYREAKITPKKTGYFVAIWQRDNEGKTIPYQITDDFDYLLISTQQGYFLYPKEELAKLNIISTKLKEGKRGMRVYPVLETEMNKQALKTYQSHLPFWNNF
ncbi:MepB family protein [Myroides odoratimimus]|uniref:MepB family protein n=1 Tax=Myroides odoratimimus TaxID=76832 RepID=UPI002577D846|nr:MepB family protein [Myroides odoratimimus]MDM1395599.1 MepB family protein [Myroides odoratimimus]